MKKVLIIEDDVDITDILTVALGARYNVFIINDTNNLIEQMDTFFPDLIITDNFVGQKVADEIVKEIRFEHRFSKIPVVLFSGHPDIEKLASQIKANSYISKPFTLKDLNACIEEIFANLESEKELFGNMKA